MLLGSGLEEVFVFDSRARVRVWVEVMVGVRVRVSIPRNSPQQGWDVLDYGAYRVGPVPIGERLRPKHPRPGWAL